LACWLAGLLCSGGLLACWLAVLGWLKRLLCLACLLRLRRSRGGVGGGAAPGLAEGLELCLAVLVVIEFRRWRFYSMWMCLPGSSMCLVGTSTPYLLSAAELRSPHQWGWRY
jgi:hypothetical protein